MNLVFAVFATIVLHVSAIEKSPIVQFSDKENTLVIENGFVRLTYDKVAESITELFGDFSGSSDFKTNVLARPFTLSTAFANASLTSSCAAKNNPEKFAKYSVMTQSDDVVEFTVTGIRDCADSPVAKENWHISLHRSERFAQVRIEGGVVASNAGVVSIGHSVYTRASSLFGLFDRGVVQMMNNPGRCMGSDQTVQRLYALGNDQSIDVLYTAYPAATSSAATSASDDGVKSSSHLSGPAEVVLYSQFGGATNSVDTYFGSGFQDVLVGSYPRKSLEMSTAWSPKCWDDAETTSVTPDITWGYTMSLGPNNMDFPVYPVPFASTTRRSSAATSATLIPDMPEIDVRTFLTGVYANPVGCLQSYYASRDGTIAPTISHPDVGYSPNTNFFDPDNYLSVSAMMYSGDQYLMHEVKKVLERTAETMCGIGNDTDAAYCEARTSTRLHPRLSSSLAVTHPSFRQGLDATAVKPRTGQLMHHFINLQPTYESIATSEQLGPNVFWTLSAIRYASLNNDAEWLQKMLPFFELSARYLTSFYDEDQGLLLVPGPLWIDVIVRENYTSDSNAIAPHIFRQLAEVFESLNALPHFSAELRRLADKITTSMNDLLWDPTSNDHYITQLNADLTTTRDFVDYDSNLLAVAFGVTPDSRVSSLLGRVDSGAYTHVRGTWCCEVPYSGDKEDCYIVGGDVCGDSIVTLGRIGWADAHARKRVGDLHTFNSLLLEPLQRDLVQDTWLFERYDANGTQIRTSYYFEYPSLVTMMLTEIRYGIDVTLSAVKVDPFPVADFTFSFGSMAVQYSQDNIQIRLNTEGSVRVTKRISVHGLSANTTYDLQSNACAADVRSLTTCAGGVLSFDYQLQTDCPILLVKRASGRFEDVSQ